MTRICAVLLLCCVSGGALAQAVPKLNVEQGCRAAASAGAGALTTVETCMKEEQNARDELAKSWASFSAIDRQQCVAEVSGFEPSYVELLECVTIARDARKLDKEEAAKSLQGDSPRKKAKQ